MPVDVREIHLEQGVVCCSEKEAVALHVQMSQALSLKRIADVLTAVAGQDPAELQSKLWQLGAQFAEGMQYIQVQGRGR